MQTRIADATDQFVSDTQFGFRRGKSTSEPLFCVRRLQDLAEAGHQNIILIFFDRTSHQRLFEERMKIDAKMINHIKALYEHPFFKTIEKTKKNEWTKQHSGIRQGCPLSPYLFIYVFIYVFIYFMMNGLFFDVRHKSNDAFSRKLSIT